MKNREQVNCIGYAYFRAGLEKRERYITPPIWKDVEDRFVEVAQEEDPDLVIVLGRIGGVTGEVCHMAFIDNRDGEMAWHRPFYGAGIEHVPLYNMISPYLDQEHYEVRFVKTKK